MNLVIWDVKQDLVLERTDEVEVVEVLTEEIEEEVQEVEETENLLKEAEDNSVQIITIMQDISIATAAFCNEITISCVLLKI